MYEQVHGSQTIHNDSCGSSQSPMFDVLVTRSSRLILTRVRRRSELQWSVAETELMGVLGVVHRRGGETSLGNEVSLLHHDTLGVEKIVTTP